MTRNVKRIGWALLVLVIVIGLPVTFLRYRAAQRMQAALEAGRAIGLVTRFADVGGMLDEHHGVVSSTENGAPLYAAAGAQLADVEVPEPEDGAALPVVDDALRRAVIAAGPAILLVEQAARLPRCRHDVRWEDGLALRLDYIRDTQLIIRALRGRVAVRVADGDVKGAVDDAGLMYALADALDEEPTLIAQMMRVVADRAADRVLREVLPSHPQPFEAWQRVSGPGPRGAVASGLRGEFALAAGVLASVSALDDTEIAAMGATPSLGERLLWFVAHGDGAMLLESYADLYDHRNDGYPALIERARANDERLAEGGVGTQLIGIRLARLVEQEAEAATSRAVTEAGARLLAFRRLMGGRLPTRLDEVPGVPTDPRTAQSLELVVTDGEAAVQAKDGVGRWVVPKPR